MIAIGMFLTLLAIVLVFISILRERDGDDRHTPGWMQDIGGICFIVGPSLMTAGLLVWLWRVMP